MKDTIAYVAVGCAIVCLGVYLALTLKIISDPREKTDKTIHELAARTKALAGPPSAKDVAELVKALASLVDSLVKAGPALWSLIGSLLFLLIAALAAGVFSSGP
jgi:hypothetical protein